MLTFAALILTNIFIKQMLTKLFGFNPQTMNVKKEILGGITTFLTMAYILAVNPSILGDAGMDKGAVFTASAISAVIATLVMALYAKLPFVLAPGMGLNAFFAYTIVLAMGYTWQFALTAVFIEGLIFILLTISGLRQKIVESIPLLLHRSISPGIGLFIAFIGLKNAGIIADDPVNLVALGNLHDPAVLLGWLGIIITTLLLIKNVMGALLVGIIITTIIGVPLGVTNFTSLVSTPPSLAPIFCQFEWTRIFSFDMLVCVCTLLFVDMFDTIGTLISMCTRAGMVDEKGKIPGLEKAFMADAVGTTLGAVLGTSTVTTFTESASGINVGGRSGLTAMSAAVCFALSLFLAPLFLAIPAQATAPALVLVGVMMMQDIRTIDFQDYLKAVPCFVCILFMPLTNSISDGILMGLISWVLLHVLCGKAKELNLGMIILAILFVLKYAFL